jgi:hypothetical protein
VERAYQGFFRRAAQGETPGYPRFQGAGRYHSFTHPQYGNGAVFDGGLLSLSWLGRIPNTPPSPHSRHAQDCHDQPRGGRLVRGYLVCRDTRPTLATDRT